MAQDPNAVRYIVVARGEGLSLGRIAQLMNAHKRWPTKSGGPWHASLVRRILQREGMK